MSHLCIFKEAFLTCSVLSFYSRQTGPNVPETVMMGIVNAEVLAYSELISERDFPGISPRPCRTFKLFTTKDSKLGCFQFLKCQIELQEITEVASFQFIS